MNFQVAVIAGDGIGPEITREARKVLDRVCEKFGHTFVYKDVLMGGASIDACGVPLTDEAIATAKASDAVLMGSIGGNTATSPWYQLAAQLKTGSRPSEDQKGAEPVCQPAPGISVQ